LPDEALALCETVAAPPRLVAHLGKAIYPEQLVQSGRLHEAARLSLMSDVGVPERRSRFGMSRGNWSSEAPVEIEDLLVALADNCWKGRRVPALEDKVMQMIANTTVTAPWEVYAALDDILQRFAANADTRLAYQARFSAANIAT
jgi:hypothetical protein